MVEDDMLPCDGALDAVAHTLADTDSYQAVFFSKFSRAFAIRSDSIRAFATAVLAALDAKPYDIVLRTGAWLPPGARMLTVPHNLFHHIGALSTVPERNTPSFARFDQLRSDVCGEMMV